MTDPTPRGEPSYDRESREWGTKLLIIACVLAFFGAMALDAALQRRTGLGSLGLSTAVMMSVWTGAHWARRRGSRWFGFAVAVGLVAASALLVALVRLMLR